MKESIKTDKAPAAAGPYSPGIREGDYLFVSGQGPFVPGTKRMAEGIEEQTRQTLENVKAIVEAAGTDMAHVVKVSVFLSNPADFARMNSVYATYFAQPFPARSTTGAALMLPGMLIEIDAIAGMGKQD